MQFITHQSHNDYHLSLSPFNFSLSLPSISFSSLVRAAPSLPALSTNSRPLSSLYGDFLSSTSSLSVCPSLSGSGCRARGTTSRLSLCRCYLVALIMTARTRDGGTELCREEGGGMECSSTAAASDCIKQPLCAAEGLMRAIVTSPSVALCFLLHIQIDYVFHLCDT